MSMVSPREFAIPAHAAVRASMLLSVVVFLILMGFGLAMRASQADMLPLDPAWFYELMTAHGVLMVGTAGFSGAAIMWHFLGRHVRLGAWAYWGHMACFLVGVACILVAVFGLGFAGAWTFLYPLPAHSAGVWDSQAAAVYLIGLLLVGIGFLILMAECGRAIMMREGSFGHAMCWPLLFRNAEQHVPPAILAATTTIIFNFIATVTGAAVILISLVNLADPSFEIDPLLGKNMIYFFGHTFINASIYMAVIAVYEIIPDYTGRPWKTTRVLAASWNALLFMVMVVYPHHLQQDTVMPAWLLVMGQVVSYANGIPLLAVTAFSLLVYICGSNMRWDLPSALLVTGVCGWSLGAVPAIADGLISVNRLMHNTQWVPGHFHTYLLLGEVAMAFGFAAWLARSHERLSFTWTARGGFALYLVGGIGFVLMFLIAGAFSVPRRWAVHLAAWWPLDRIATAFAVLTITGIGVMLMPLAPRLIRPRR